MAPRMKSSSAAEPRSRRVLLYSMNFTPEPIGIGKYSGELAEYLSASGYQVEVVAAVPHYPGWQIFKKHRNWWRTETNNGVRISRCPLYVCRNMRGLSRVLCPISFALSSAITVIWRVLVFRPATIMCVEPTLFAAPAALLASALTGARTVLHVQDLEIDAAFAVAHLRGKWLRRLAEAYERLVMKSFDQVVTISLKMRDLIRGKGVKPERLSVVRNWVDTNEIKPMACPSPFRAELGIPDSTFVVLYSGNLGLKQGLEIIPEIAAKLVEHKDILFLLFGDGPEKAGLIEKSKSLPNLRVYPLQPRERLSALLNLADAHILTQRQGTTDLVLPSKLGGMLASGRHCIVMADAGTELHEFLQGAAILLKPGNIEECSEVILHLRGTMPDGCAALQRCLGEMGADACLSRFSEILVG
ncbi:MAG: WcaI family glycosyltransferase [Formivibrio sp.]|nr:WcaI family glycosyltransferase [Formivibrio sp.]